MNNIFSYDNPFIRGINKVVDFACLALLWGIFSIPVITLGTSTTAFYYTFNKVIRKDNGYLWKSFWHAFKANFKQSTLLFLIQIVIYAFSIFNCYVAFLMYQSLLPSFVCWVIWGIGIGIVMWTCCWIPYTARFNDSVKTVIKNSGVMTLMNLHWALLVLIMLVASVVLVYIFVFGILLIPALYLAGSCWIYEKIFGKYSALDEDDVVAEEWSVEEQQGV